VEVNRVCWSCWLRLGKDGEPVGEGVNRVWLYVLAVEIGDLTPAGNQLWGTVGCKLYGP
jgi:hypothetical protein